jgi:hypothetical protein
MKHTFFYKGSTGTGLLYKLIYKFVGNKTFFSSSEGPDWFVLISHWMKTSLQCWRYHHETHFFYKSRTGTSLFYLLFYKFVGNKTFFSSYSEGPDWFMLISHWRKTSLQCWRYHHETHFFYKSRTGTSLFYLLFYKFVGNKTFFSSSEGPDWFVLISHWRKTSLQCWR